MWKEVCLRPLLFLDDSCLSDSGTIHPSPKILFNFQWTFLEKLSSCKFSYGTKRYRRPNRILSHQCHLISYFFHGKMNDWSSLESRNKTLDCSSLLQRKRNFCVIFAVLIQVIRWSELLYEVLDLITMQHQSIINEELDNQQAWT